MAEVSYWRAYGVFLYSYATGFADKKEVLDIGSGSGKGAQLLSQFTTKRVVGIDKAKKAYRQARKIETGKVLFIQMDVKDLANLKNTFGLITMFNTFEHLTSKEQKRVLKDVEVLLEKNGVFLLATNNSAYTKIKNPFHKHEVTGKELMGLLKKHFKTEMIGIEQRHDPRFKQDGGLNRVVSLLFSRAFMQELIQPLVPRKIKELLNTHVLKILPEKVSDFTLSEYSEKAENFLAVCTHK